MTRFNHLFEFMFQSALPGRLHLTTKLPRGSRSQSDQSAPPSPPHEPLLFARRAASGRRRRLYRVGDVEGITA